MIHQIGEHIKQFFCLFKIQDFMQSAHLIISCNQNLTWQRFIYVIPTLCSNLTEIIKFSFFLSKNINLILLITQKLRNKSQKLHKELV